MSIVGLNYTKISAEKTAPLKGKININNNVAIDDISSSQLSFYGSKTESLVFKFTFTSKYEPKMGLIEIKGELIYKTDKKAAKEVEDKWKKSKAIKKSLMAEVSNYLLEKCNIEALWLSKDMGFPPPVPMPKIALDDSKEGS